MNRLLKEGEPETGVLEVLVDPLTMKDALETARNFRGLSRLGYVFRELVFALNDSQKVEFVPVEVQNGVCARARLELPNEQIGSLAPWQIQSFFYTCMVKIR